MINTLFEFLQNNFITGWIAPFVTGALSTGAIVIYNKYKINTKIKKNRFIDMFNDTYNVLYNYGVQKKSIFCEKDKVNKKIILHIIFDKVTMQPLSDIGWAGYAIKKLPIRYFKYYVKNHYYIKFNAMMNGNIDFITVEIKTGKNELIKKRFKLSEENQEYFICLHDFIDTVDDWEDVQEICFVFFPNKDIEQKGKVIISELRIEK